MAKKTPTRYTMIYDYVNQYYAENSRYPSVRDIVAGTGIPVSTVHRYLNDMKESGEIEYNGRRSISTECLTLLKGLKAKQPVGTKLMFPSL